MQNITQIFYNKNFFDAEFNGNLVLRKDQIEHIRKISPSTLESFKLQQSKEISSCDANRELAMELDTHIGYFTDILIGDKPESYIYTTSLMCDDRKEIHEGYDDTPVEMFRPAFDLLQTVLDGLELYGEQLDEPKMKKYENDLERNRKREEKGKTLCPIKPFER